jgi:hypothetical protein
MRPRTLRCDLGPTSVTLVTNHQAVVDYLHNFYTLVEDRAAAGAWVVEAVVGPVPDTMTVNRWGVGYAADATTRRLRLRGPDPYRLAITARTSVREALVDYCEQRRYVMLHASAVTDDRRVVVFVGAHGSGKTTLALRAVLFHGMRYLSNDHLIVYPDGDAGRAAPPAAQLCLTTLPGPIALKLGTYLDLEDRLPPPFDTEGLAVDAYRRRPREQVYGRDLRVIYTYRGLGQDNPLLVRLGDPANGPAVRVVLVGYALAGAGGAPAPVPDPVAALMPHLRTDWMFNPARNLHHLPRAERRPAAYLADAGRLLRALTERATVTRWSHRGDPDPLLGHR